MAVSFIATPPANPTRVSTSYQTLYVVRGDQYKAANVTQHRFRLTLTEGLTTVAEKYTVVDDEVNKRGRFDLSQLLKALKELSPAANGGTSPITQITAPISVRTDGDASVVYTVRVYEEYYLSGVFTSNGPVIHTLYAFRGWTDQIANVWLYENWHRRNGRDRFISYSGKGFQVYPQKTTDPAWPDDTVKPYMNIEVNSRPGNAASFWFDRRNAGYFPVVYFPMVYAGFTDSPNSAGLTIKVGVSSNNGPGPGYEQIEIYDIDKTVRDCENEDVVLMFRDSLYQWNFMHFPMKSRTILNSESQRGELVPEADFPGRFRYNVETAETLQLNTDWMDEEQNPLITDLFSSERVYLVDQSDGSLEQVVVVPSSLRLKRRWTDNMIQYAMSVKKSLDNFSA